MSSRNPSNDPEKNALFFFELELYKIQENITRFYSATKAIETSIQYLNTDMVILIEHFENFKKKQRTFDRTVGIMNDLCQDYLSIGQIDLDLVQIRRENMSKLDEFKVAIVNEKVLIEKQNKLINLNKTYFERIDSKIRYLDTETVLMESNKDLLDDMFPKELVSRMDLDMSHVNDALRNMKKIIEVTTDLKSLIPPPIPPRGERTLFGPRTPFRPEYRARGDSTTSGYRPADDVQRSSNPAIVRQVTAPRSENATLVRRTLSLSETVTYNYKTVTPEISEPVSGRNINVRPPSKRPTNVSQQSVRPENVPQPSGSRANVPQPSGSRANVPQPSGRPTNVSQPSESPANVSQRSQRPKAMYRKFWEVI